MATMAAPVGDITIERAGAAVGAWVRGVDLAGPWPQHMAARLRRALHEHGVLVFRFDDVVSAAAFAAFGALFGEIEDGYRISTVEDRPKAAGEGVIDSDRAPMRQFNVNEWHSDGTLFAQPPQAAMLTPVELPPMGGDTMWAGMYAAYDALSSHWQRLLDGVEVLHSARRLAWLKSDATAVHPAVIRDPVTGRRALFVNANYSDRIVGMSDRESEDVLGMLFRHVNTPEFHFRLRWRPGMIAVWEERVTQHRGVADFTGPRKLRRLTFVGDRPVA